MRWNNVKDFLWMALAIIALVVLTQVCTRSAPQYTITSDTIYIFDTVYQIDTFQMPGPVVVIPPETIPIYITPEECSELWRLYYSHVIYNDTLRNDSLAFISILDTVYENRLLGRVLTYRDNTPIQQIINSTTIFADTPKLRFSFGAAITLIDGHGLGFGPSVMLTDKQLRSYAYTYDITSKAHYLSLYFSIIRGKRGN